MWFADRQMGPSLIAYGRPDQQDEFLPGMLSGETTWCIGMSEPNAGSDLASLKTQAGRDGDEYVINGQKIWTSFGLVADYCYVICRTTNEGPPHQGISEIIVPMDTPGIEVRPIKDMTTNQHFCEVFFTDVRVPVTNLVGVEGNAFKQTMTQLEHERGGIDRLVEQPGAVPARLRASRHDRPEGPPGNRRARDRLSDGPDPRDTRGAQAGTAWLLRRDQVLLHRARVARRRVRRPGPTAPKRPCGTTSSTVCCMPPATRSWAARRTSCATSSASESSASHASPAEEYGGPTGSGGAT